MKRKIFSLVLAFTMILPLTSCGGKRGDDSRPGVSNPSSASEPQTSGSTEKLTLKLTHPNPETHVFHAASEVFKEEVETLTNGNVTVEIYPNGQLGDSKEIVQSLSMGAVELNISSSAQMSTFNDELNVLDLPFLFDSRETAYEKLDGEAGDRLGQGLESSHIKVLGYLDGGYRCMFNNKRSLEHPDDFKGLAVRVQDSEVYFNMMKALGALPSFIGWGDLYVSISQGIVDAGESGVAQIYSQRFHEVAPYISLTNHTFTANIFMMNKDKWDAMPADYQEAVMKAARKMVEFEREQMVVSEQEAMENLKAEKAVINEVDAAEFQAAVTSVWDDFAARQGQELVDLFIQ